MTGTNPNAFVGAGGPAGGVLTGTYPNPGLAALSGLQRVASTAAAGFALTNGTGNIFTFTSPNDGNNHRYVLITDWHVSVAETGGACTFTFTAPDASVDVSTFKPGGQGTGNFLPAGPQMAVVGANTAVTVAQSSALSVGTTQLWAELWGS